MYFSHVHGHLEGEQHNPILKGDFFINHGPISTTYPSPQMILQALQTISKIPTGVFFTPTTFREDLRAGTTIICDRYAFSGVAYSAAKGGVGKWPCSGGEGATGYICLDLPFVLKICAFSLFTQKNLPKGSNFTYLDIYT